MTLEECRGVAWAWFAVFSIVRGTDKEPVFQCMARCPLSILQVHIWIIPTESRLFVICSFSRSAPCGDRPSPPIFKSQCFPCSAESTLLTRKCF